MPNLIAPLLLAEFIFSFIFIFIFGFKVFFLESLITLFAGVFLIKNLVNNLQESIQCLNSQSVFKNPLTPIIARSLGAFFIIVPGILTDILGLILIIFSSTRTQKKEFKQTDDDVIDVEVID